MSDTLYERYNTGDNGGATFYGSAWKGQTFTIGNTGTNENHNITSVKLKVYKAGSPGTITVSIRAVDGSGNPTGNDLTSGTTDGDTLTTNTAGEWREISLTSYGLSASTTYAIVVRAPNGDSSNYAGWRTVSPGASYEGGFYAWSSNSGSSWLHSTAVDFMFEEYGTAGGGPETHTPSDTAKASDSPAFKPGIPLSDTAKASDGLTTIAKSVLGDTAKASDAPQFKAQIPLTDTAKASDSPAFKPGIPISDTAKASDALTIKASSVLEDIAKASDFIDFIMDHKQDLSDTAKASDALTTKALSILEDTAKASDSVEFREFTGHLIEDTAKASDFIAFIMDHKQDLSDTAKASDALVIKVSSILEDTSKASDLVVFKPGVVLIDTAKASDSVEFTYIAGIETPTDDVQIFRNDLSL